MFSPLHMDYNDQLHWTKKATKDEPTSKQLAFFDADLLGSQIQAVPRQQFYHHSLPPPDLTNFNCSNSGMQMGLWTEPNASTTFPSLHAEAFRSSQRQNLREFYSRTTEDQAFADQFNSDSAFASLFQPLGNPTPSQNFKTFLPSNLNGYVAPENTNSFVQFPATTIAQNPMAQKQRINSWTSQEEAFLIGVVVAKYLSQGSLFGNEENPKKRSRDEGKKSKSSAIEACWESIKEAFDNVWDRYKAKTGFGRPCERTAQALSRHYKVMKTKLKTGKQRSFHSLYFIWRNEYDFNHALLHPDYFAIQDHLKKKSLGLERSHHGSMQSVLKDDQGRSLTPALSDPEMPSFYQGSGEQFQRVNSWNKHEETILVGVVVDRFIKRGSLVSPRKTADDDDEESDCWSTIKRSYDLAWSRFTDASGVAKPLDRTVNALSRHYKVLRSRLTNNVKSLLDQNQDSMVVSKETKQNLTLSQMYDTWVINYNSNDALISPDEQ